MFEQFHSVLSFLFVSALSKVSCQFGGLVKAEPDSSLQTEHNAHHFRGTMLIWLRKAEILRNKVIRTARCKLRSNLGASALAYKLKFKQKRQIPAVLHFREALELKHA